MELPYVDPLFSDLNSREEDGDETEDFERVNIAARIIA